jgi:hypothetical protein
LDLMRVPLPAARTAAKVGASWRSNTGFHDSYPYDIDAQGFPGTTLAGAAGFEPAIPGPKPGALPLGYAPSRTPRSRLSQDCPQLSRLYRSLSRVSAKDLRPQSAKDLRLQSARGRRLFGLAGGRTSKYLYPPRHRLADEDESCSQPIRRGPSLRLRSEDTKDRGTRTAHRGPQSSHAKQRFLQRPHLGH